LSRQESLVRKLEARFRPDHLEVTNESGQHNVPPGSETHFRVVLVSEAFSGQRRIDRHRSVNDALAGELADGMHALALHLYTPDEWRQRYGEAPLSPPCLGGKAREVRS